MFAKCPVACPGTADEAANAVELLMSYKGASITGATFLIDGGATSNYYYGPLGPRKKAQIKVSEFFPLQLQIRRERPRQAGSHGFYRFLPPWQSHSTSTYNPELRGYPAFGQFAS